ncbi:MAG: ABC-F family ATP-binding cassette domain-containing protein [Armatimonadota bacterium]
MAILLSCQDLSKSYANRPLFSGISFGVAEGERVGLLGANGSGKSTLLRILASQEEPDRGTVSIRRNVRLGYLPQEDDFPPGATPESVLSEALSGHGWDERERAEKLEAMLVRAGFTRGDQPAETLSGGWRKRLALARELIREPDLLLIDEPTNHLDLEGILWLEAELRDAPFAFVLVSHDRTLLQNAANRIVELSPVYAEGYLSVNGSYTEFLERRDEYLRAQANEQEALQSKVRREVEWLRQNAQARSTKQQARIKEAGRLIGELSEVRFRNNQGQVAEIDFQASGRKTRELLVAKGLEKQLGEKTLFRGLDLLLSPGRRLGLLGPNGSGKTTLLRLLSGELEPDRGTMTRADGLRTVYFDQNRRRLDPKTPLRDALAPEGDMVLYRGRQMHVAAWAKRFLFRTDQFGMPVGQLSGGEQARVLIARLMLEQTDLLILDEPTNDLDLATLDVLEESLTSFPGALVLVTHDRYLLDQVCTDVLGLDGRGGHAFYADYSQWERAQAARQEARREVEARRAAPAAAAPPKARISLAELKELSQLEKKIEAAEREQGELEARLSDPAVASDHVKIQECWEAIEAAKGRVADLYARWEELELKRSGA